MLTDLLTKQDVVILDGGLATELEQMGHDLNDPLWSARLLITNPEAIYKVHSSYLEAGADCITSATYQASVPGFVRAGFSEKQATGLMQGAVRLAVQARDQYAETGTQFPHQRPRPLVAASIGPYGAYLADGSEFRGDYAVSAETLRAFHEPRWQILAETSADLFACETIPSLMEAEVLRELLAEAPAVQAWVSFSCKDEECISDGTPLRECAALFAGCDQIVAVGVNCTAPQYMAPLITEIRVAAPDKLVVVYPNSGEVYDAANRVWIGTGSAGEFSDAALHWRELGARLIGGCCRTRPGHIRTLRRSLLKPQPDSPN